MNTLTHVITLLYFDYPQVFIAKDLVGTYYICMVVSEEDVPIYYATALSPVRCRTLAIGKEDLRHIYSNPEITQYYLVRPTGIEQYSVEPSEFIEAYLPDEGLVLENFYTEELLEEIALQQSPIAIAHLLPFEAKQDLRIHSKKLSRFLQVFEDVVKHITPKDKDAAISERILNYTDVYGVAYGSFAVKFRASSNSDLFMDVSEISEAFKRFNHLLKLSNNPTVLLATFSEYKLKIRAINSWLELLSFIKEEQCPIQYECAIPLENQVYTAYLDIPAAAASYQQIKATITNEEIVEAVGILDSVGYSNRSWKIITEDGTSYSGSIDTDSDASLAGVVIKDQTYRIKFRTIQEIDQSVRKYTKNLAFYLKNISTA